MRKTKIEWCDSTWNPVMGCYHGCEYCYARKMARRFAAIEQERILFGDKSSDPKLHVQEEKVQYRCADGKFRTCSSPYGFEPTLYPYRLDEPQKWKKPKNIFVCSMADLFGEWVPDGWIEAVFDACEKAPQHRYFFLTKNPQRYVDIMLAGKLPKGNNMWYGTTATTPNEDFFIGKDKMWNTFVSVEPIRADFDGCGTINMRKNFCQWVIVGAETGTHRNKVIPKPTWIEAISLTCKRNGVALFMKDSLIPIVGEENMVREFPWETVEETQDRKGAKEECRTLTNVFSQGGSVLTPS